MEEEKKEVKKQDTKQTAGAKKKVETTKKAKKGSNKQLIWIGVAIVAVILVAIVVYLCMANANSPKKALETFLDELKSGEYNSSVLDNTFSGDSMDEQIEKLFFDKLQWKIKNVKQEGDTATVELEVTNKDFKTVIGNYMQKAIKAAFGGQEVTEEEMTNYLVEELSKEDLQTVTSTQSIGLEKKDGEWDIADKDTLVGILLPGFMDAISAISAE